MLGSQTCSSLACSLKAAGIGLSGLLRGTVIGASTHESGVPAHASALDWGSTLVQHRCATKKAGGSAKQNVGSHPKNLGMKMCAGELAFPGMILVRQRGTKFYPGNNVEIGRDHTLFATGIGVVRVSSHTTQHGKERRVVSLEPLPIPASVSTEELVRRRADIKRAMLAGGKPLEPALHFKLPTKPDGQLTWMGASGQ